MERRWGVSKAVMACTCTATQLVLVVTWRSRPEVLMKREEMGWGFVVDHHRDRRRRRPPTTTTTNKGLAQRATPPPHDDGV
jgi:hypothetical protein